MLPASEFSMGKTPKSQVPSATAANASSKDGLGAGVTVSPKCAKTAASEYAPGSPWKATL